MKKFCLHNRIGCFTLISTLGDREMMWPKYGKIKHEVVSLVNFMSNLCIWFPVLVARKFKRNIFFLCYTICDTLPVVSPTNRWKFTTLRIKLKKSVYPYQWSKHLNTNYLDSKYCTNLSLFLWQFSRQSIGYLANFSWPDQSKVTCVNSNYAISYHIGMKNISQTDANKDTVTWSCLKKTNLSPEWHLA